MQQRQLPENAGSGFPERGIAEQFAKNDRRKHGLLRPQGDFNGINIVTLLSGESHPRNTGLKDLAQLLWPIRRAAGGEGHAAQQGSARPASGDLVAGIEIVCGQHVHIRLPQAMQ